MRLLTATRVGADLVGAALREQFSFRQVPVWPHAAIAESPIHEVIPLYRRVAMVTIDRDATPSSLVNSFERLKPLSSFSSDRTNTL